MKNTHNQLEYVEIHVVDKDVVKIYKHYRNPVSGCLVNSGKIELVAIIPTHEYREGQRC